MGDGPLPIAARCHRARSTAHAPLAAPQRRGASSRRHLRRGGHRERRGARSTHLHVSGAVAGHVVGEILLVLVLSPSPSSPPPRPLPLPVLSASSSSPPPRPRCGPHSSRAARQSIARHPMARGTSGLRARRGGALPQREGRGAAPLAPPGSATGALARHASPRCATACTTSASARPGDALIPAPPCAAVGICEGGCVPAHGSGQHLAGHRRDARDGGATHTGTNESARRCELPARTVTLCADFARVSL